MKNDKVRTGRREDSRLEEEEGVLMMLDEKGVSNENLQVKVTSYTSNKVEQSRGQKETAVPMELDYVSGSEMYEEEQRGIRRFLAAE